MFRFFSNALLAVRCNPLEQGLPAKNDDGVYLIHRSVAFASKLCSYTIKGEMLWQLSL